MLRIRNIIAALELYHSRLTVLKLQGKLLGPFYEIDGSYGQELSDIQAEAEEIHSNLQVLDGLIQRYKHENL